MTPLSTSAAEGLAIADAMLSEEAAPAEPSDSVLTRKAAPAPENAPATDIAPAPDTTLASAPDPADAPAPTLTDDQRRLFSAWDNKGVISRVFFDAGELSDESAQGLFQLEIFYYSGDLANARALATKLLDAPEPAVALSARATRMEAAVGMGDAASAYEDLCVLRTSCKRGLANPAERQLFASSYICALRVESLAMTKFFDFPGLTDGLDAIPRGLKTYFGYLLALRLLRSGHPAEAVGMAYTFQTLIGPKFPISRVRLHLISACANITLSRISVARHEFEEAWTLKDDYHIIMPFVELSYPLLGLQRPYGLKAGQNEAAHVRAITAVRSEGWYALRRMLGLPTVTQGLTQLELQTAGLAAIGWRNKEIAAHLAISENTVKHQLSSVYQKLGLQNRSDIRDLFQGIGDSPTLWA